MLISVRSSSGAAVPTGGPVSWTAYTSADGVHWLSAGGAAVFDPVQSAYVVTFNRTNARYFKAVNFGVNLLDTFVTEIQALVHDTVQTTVSRTTRTTSQSATARVTYTPVHRVVLQYLGAANTSESTGTGALASSGTDLSNRLVMTLTPDDTQTFSGQYARSDSERVGFPARSSQIASLLASFTPLPTLVVGGHGAWALDEAVPDRAETLSAGVDGSAQVLPALRALAALDLSHRTAVSATGPMPSLTYTTASSAVFARLLPDLDGVLTATAQRSVSGSSGAAATSVVAPVVLYQQYLATLDYHPTPALLVGGRWGLYEGQTSGFVHGYRATWSPFRGSAVQFTVSYDLDFDLLTGNRARHAFVSGRWEVNAHTNLNVSYTDVANSGATSSTHLQQFFVNLGLHT